MSSISLRSNPGAISTARQLGRSQALVDQAMLRLSTGLRINRAADDAAGLAVSEKMRAQIGGLSQASRNARDAASLAQTAEGGLAEIGNILLRMRNLGVQAISDTNTTSDRTALQTEMTALQAEVTRLAESSEFNGLKLLDGSFIGKRFQVGANPGQELRLSIGGIDSSSLGAGVAATNGTIASAKAAAVPLTSNGVAPQTLTVTGPSGTGSIAVAASSTAETIANQITASAAGVTGRAETNVRITATAPGSGVAHVHFILGSSDGGGVLTGSSPIDAQILANGDLSEVITRINQQSSASGISAVAGSSVTQMILTQASGKDIILQDSFADAGAGPTSLLSATGLAASATSSTLSAVGSAIAIPVNGAAIVGGVVRLSSSGSLSVSTSLAGTLFSSSTASSSSASLSTMSVASADQAMASIDVVDAALLTVNDERANLGAFQNRIDATISNLESSIENLTMAESRVRDADVAIEASQLARSLVLVEAGVAVMAQANQSPRLALRLLGIAA